MLNSIFKAAGNIKMGGGEENNYRKLLKESTSNEAWNISNTKLQVIADHTHNWDDLQVIMKHLWEKLQVKPKEWKRTAKALHVLDYLVKNGAPRVIQDLKDDLYKVRQLQDFSYKDSNGIEQGAELRDKARGLYELCNDPNKLQYEREFAKSTREKFSGMTGTVSSGNVPAGPSSGKQYGGFGSEDIAKLGYNNQDQFGSTGPYDPYVKTGNEPKKEPKKKNFIAPKMDDSDNESISSLDSDADSDDSEVQQKKAKLKRREEKKKAAEAAAAEEKNKQEAPEAPAQSTFKGLGNAPKAARQLAGTANAPQPAQAQPQQQSNLFDLLGGPQQQQPVQQQQNAFNFMNAQAPNQPQVQPMQQMQMPQQPMMQQQQPNAGGNLFGGLNVQQQQMPQQQQQPKSDFGFMNQPVPNQQQMQVPTQQMPQQTMNDPFAASGGSMFSGMNMQSQQQQPSVQQSATPAVAQPVQMEETKQAAKPTMWDQNSNLFDLSASSLKSQAPPQKQVPLQPLTVNPPNQQLMDAFSDSPAMRVPNAQAGFKPALDPNQLMANMTQQQQQQQIMMNMQLQQQQMAMMQQQNAGQLLNTMPNPLGMQQQPMQFGQMPQQQFGQQPGFNANQFGQQQQQFNQGMNQGQFPGQYGQQNQGGSNFNFMK